jgi:hypothetical protein
MTPKLTVEKNGTVTCNGIRLPFRFISERQSISCVIKDRRKWAKHGKYIEIPLSELSRLEQKQNQSNK